MRTKKRGKIFVISSPSGGGKTTICKCLRESRFDVKYSISATTRQQRPGEKNGRDYIFLTEEQFKRQLEKKAFLEWEENFGDFYGTPKGYVKRVRAKGKDVILTIDVKGAMQVRKAVKDAVLIFIVPPSLKLLKERLKNRKTETRNMRERRLEAAKRELSYVKRYDYSIINDNLNKAVDTLKSIIIAERNKVNR